MTGEERHVGGSSVWSWPPTSHPRPPPPPDLASCCLHPPPLHPLVWHWSGGDTPAPTLYGGSGSGKMRGGDWGEEWRQPIGKWRYFTDLGFHLLPLAHRKRTTMKGDASSRTKTSYAGEYVFCLKYSAPHVESPTRHGALLSTRK
jgi:hypothetical protein